MLSLHIFPINTFSSSNFFVISSQKTKKKKKLSLNLQENFRREGRRDGGGTFWDSVDVVELKKINDFSNSSTNCPVWWPKRPYVLLQDYKTYNNLIAHTTPPTKHRKQPPQEMSFMMNFDGVVFKEQCTLGAGVFIRDDNWYLIATLSCKGRAIMD